MENPYSWTVSSGCQNGRVSSIHRTAAMPVLIAASSRTVRTLKRNPAASVSAKVFMSARNLMRAIVGVRSTGPVNRRQDAARADEAPVAPLCRSACLGQAPGERDQAVDRFDAFGLRGYQREPDAPTAGVAAVRVAGHEASRQHGDVLFLEEAPRELRVVDGGLRPKVERGLGHRARQHRGDRRLKA